MTRPTKLVPKLAAFVGHGRSLGPPDDESRVSQKLLGDETQHACPVGIARSKHLLHLHRRKEQVSTRVQTENGMRYE